MHKSDTSTRHGNEPSYCNRCLYPIHMCICEFDTIDFPDEKINAPKEIKAQIVNTKSLITRMASIQKNIHSLSGCKGLKLLKKLDKR